MSDGTQNVQSNQSSLAAWLGVRPPRRIPHPFIAGQWIEAGQLWPAGDSGAYSNAAIQGDMDGALRGGSWNYSMVAGANAVARGQAGADALMLSWLGKMKATLGWMGKEVGSRDGGYWYFFLVSAAVLARKGSPALAALAWEWLDLWRFWSWTGAPITGERSALPGLHLWTICDETSDFVAGRGPAPATNPPTLDRLLIRAIMPELEQLRSRPLANPKWALATPVTFFVGSDSAMVTLDRGVDANTLPVLIGKRALGSAPNRATTWAPTPPWGAVEKDGKVDRIREVDDHAAAVVQGAAYYTSTIFKAVDVPLPAAPIKVYHLGSGSIVPDGAVAAAAQAPPPAPGPGGRAPTIAGGSVMPKSGPAGCLVSSLIELGVIAAAVWSLVAVLGGP